MQIDWITVSAQIVNFLVLVWLLKRFLYRPVIDAMDRREQRISDRLNQAQERERDAEEEAEHYRARQHELEREREDILAEARDAAGEEKRQLFDDARDEVDEQRRQWQRQVEQERHEFMEGLRRRATESIQAIARRALEDLADSELEERIVQRFIGRLKAADKDTRKALAAGEGAVRIHSSFALDSSVRGRLTRAVHELLGSDVDVDYAHDEALLCGIELRRAERRLSWNLADYLDQLEQRLDEAFEPLATAKSEDR
jgi:F-type H+-transporting ATPase subunit b